ncbi:alpha-1,2-mannosyltransferase [Malassezia pachydermatis]
MTRSPVHFGLVPQEHWSYPSWIDQDKAASQRKKMHEANIIYGGSESYRHMCRFQSGFFWRHPLTYELGLEYYWRVEPDIKIFCDVDYDPFLFMQLNNKAYGFTMSIHEYPLTIPTLWDETKKFVQAHPEYVAPDNAMGFITDKPNNIADSTYNMCHFWSNFEIGDLRFWRGQQYMDYFTTLDKAGGVCMEYTNNAVLL